MKMTGLCFLGLAFLISACNNDETKHPAANKKDTLQSTGEAVVKGNFSTQTVLHFDSTEVKQFLAKYPQLSTYKDNLLKFYSARNYSYAWFDNNGLIEQAGNLLNRLENLPVEGLPDNVLYKDSLENLLPSQSENSFTPSPETELMLTSQYFFYASKVWGGLDPKATLSVDWFIPRKQISKVDLLDSLLATNSTARLYRQYYLLRDQLKRYREIENQGGWPVITTGNYKSGDTSENIKLIRKYLFITGDMTVADSSNKYDDAVAEGIKHFQRRMGMKDDGVAGKTVINAMNVPVAKRIEQIVVNMERCRWLPTVPQRDYLVVNIPEFRLHVYDNDSLQWSMNVVVGQAVHKTVIFSGDLKYVVFSPYWNVPPGILKSEVLPGMQRDPNYLKRHNMERYAHGVRQKPGPNNSLGLVKFLFPNSYNIYLHDSPARSLFQENRRAFSHGCIRLAEPKKLAMYLLRDEQQWTDKKVTTAMNAGKEQYVTLKDPVPVFIVYFTAWVDREGNANFREDIYKRDDRLAKMIMETAK